MKRRLAITLVLAMLLPFPVNQASANSFAALESRLSISFSSSVVGDGRSRNISHTVTVSDSRGELTLNSPTGSQVRILEFRIFACSTQQAAIQVTQDSTQSGCRPWITNFTRSHTVTTHIETRRTSGAVADSIPLEFAFITPRLTVQDISGVRVSFYGNAIRTDEPVSGSQSPTSGGEYVGPLILELLNKRAVLAGESVGFQGRKLYEVFSARIGSFSASVSHSPNGLMTIGTHRSLAPGVYDLVMQSRYGTLTHINAVKIKAPTPRRTLMFRGSGQYLNESQAQALALFHKSLTSEHSKLRCVVNAASADTAKTVAARACALLARGDASEIEVIHDIRTTFKHSGFWVRIYATG